MPTYVVQVHGRNFLVDLEGRVAKRGFLTFRVVDVSEPAAAETAAIESVRTTQSLRDLVRNEASDPPVMEIEELREFEPGGAPKDVPTGFVWYEDSPKRWWQFWRQ
jgi:hypothetical protein